MRLRQLAFLCFAAILLAGCGSRIQPYATVLGSNGIGNGPEIPPEVAGHEQEWPLANHDYSNTRTAVGSSINSGNVKDLRVAWSASLSGTSEWGAATGAPVISGGRVYFQDLAANVYCVDLKSGKQVWETQYGNKIFGPAGPGIGYGKVFAISRIDRYSALDMQTGRTLWEWVTGTQLATGAFQPYVFNHVVYTALQSAVEGQGQVSFQSYHGGTSGAVYTLDPNTGRPMWEWRVVPPSFWGHPDVNSGGGLWFPPAIDTATGVTFWSSGNPSPVPGIKGWPNGSSRPGPDLFTDSLIALDRSGKMVWYNQVKPHDLFNLDFQISPMLATVNINGSAKKIVIGSGKLGVVYGFDEQTGQILWKTPVGDHKNDTLQSLPLDPSSTTWVAPGAWGGVESPMAFDDGIAYVLTENIPSPYNATAYNADTPGQALNRSEGGSHLDTGSSVLYAINASNGKVLWQHPFDKPDFSGVTVVNDLLFTADFSGMVYALRRSDGQPVWSWQAPGGTNSWPALAGDSLIWAFGLGDSPSVLSLSLSGFSTLPAPEPQRTPVTTPEGP